ncbi:heme exporter protein CcmD [Roseibium sediminicola]|uniref:Heme exporter protein D n=1 Tax=Roseibium sediminicola TaxID=2933272 RepID=A0ABT0GU23_9HYPH|nr:heme exporter protein CcmD [Roseibium sp. CAU 1639]MCK7612313.1 heme exporter protein CcmD [Roseibium sp. CAU 1639]
MDLGPHAGFIIASYGLCLATVIGLIAWVHIDKANQEKALKELAAQGISRARPDGKDATPS